MKTPIVALFLAFLAITVSADDDFLSFRSHESVAGAIVAGELIAFVEMFKTFSHELFDYVAQVSKNPENLTAENIIGTLKSLNKTSVCNHCKAFVQHQQKMMDSKAVVGAISKTGLEACKLFMNASVCEGIVGNYVANVISALSKRLFRPEITCAKMFLCPHDFHVETIKQFIKQVLGNSSRVEPPKPTLRSTYKFLHITDLHVDFSYTVGNNAYCNQPLCCREEDGPVSDPAKGAQYWGTVAGCDLPMRTIEQFFQFVANNLDIDFIIWTGDNIAHNIWEQEKATQAQNTYEITKALQKYLPNTPVYPIFGNHECFPADQCDFYKGANDWLTGPLAEMWQSWLDEQAAESLKTNTYYTMYNKDMNLRLISINTQACDTENFYIIANPTDPMGQLAWLDKVLTQAEQNGENVFIFGHIPPGDSTCDSDWSVRYNVLIERFSHIIRGQFFGHTHNDQLEVTKSFKDKKTPTGVVFIAPSLTTFSNLNPSFRVFEADSDTHTILNYYQYRLNLTKWNKNTTGPLSWDLAYDALSAYQLPDLSPASVEAFVERMAKDKQLMSTYISHFYTGNVPKKVPHEKVFYCYAKHGVFIEAFKCAFPHDLKHLMLVIQQYLPGRWYSFDNDQNIDI